MSRYRTYPICPVVLVDEGDPARPHYPLSFAAVRHVFEELAQRYDPEQVADMVIAIELGDGWRLDAERLRLKRIRGARRAQLGAVGVAWCPEHGTQRIDAAPETA